MFRWIPAPPCGFLFARMLPVCAKRQGPARARLALAPTVALLAAAAPLFSACSPSAEGGADEAAVRVLAAPLEKPDLALLDVNGERYDFRERTAGFVTLLFFGYTSCPDVCPVQMANIGAVLRDLPAESASRIKVVFVTTDPERDTQERLREWLGRMHPSFVGLRGSVEQVNAAEASLLLPQSVAEPPHGAPSHGAPPEYFVGHATPVVVFDADGLARRMYPAGTRQQDWRRDLPRLVEAAPAAPAASRTGG
jgi:protein SCO1/2